jgi:nucleoside-diphosphate-sugar epimerase
MSPRKIVITGALGHIGSRLIRTLPAAFPGCEFALVDDMSAQRYCSTFNLPAGVRYRFYEQNVLEADLKPIVAGADVVVHLAAITDAAGSFSRREQVEHNNFHATEKVAEACLAAGSALFALSSTSVYGTQKETVDEDCSEEDLKPQSPYAETKIKEEKLLARLGADHGLRFITCRFGTIFGTSPGMRFHTAVNKFCWQAVNGQPVTVWRTALHQYRPYLDLEDAAAAVAFVLGRDLFDGRIYNVLTLNATVNDILEAIRAGIPDLKVEFVDAQIMNQLSYRVDSRKFNALGFTPRGDLARGVGDTLALLRGLHRA